LVYGAGPHDSIKNGGMDHGGGFSDVQAHLNVEAHHYVFTFTPGSSITDFSIHMLDYGDWNPNLDPKTGKPFTKHFGQLSGLDAGNALVAQQTLQYTTPAQTLPTSSNLYGNLQNTGDAISALPGQLGNWTWHVTGTGIVQVKLDFGDGPDPNLALDHVSFTGCFP
jgi:hypothetical protein